MIIYGTMSKWLEAQTIFYSLLGGSSPSIYTINGSGPYMSLYTTSPWESGSGVEVSGTNYTRVPIADIFSQYNSPDDGISLDEIDINTLQSLTYYNSASIAFPIAGNNWGKVTHVGITTGSLGCTTGSALLFYGKISELGLAITTNDRLQIPPYKFLITLYGSYGAYLAQAIFESCLNNADTDIGTVRYIALMDENDIEISDPSSYARHMAYGGVWQDDWSSGSTSNTVEIDFGRATYDWGWVNSIRIYDSDTGGNILFNANLSASRTVYQGDRILFNVGSINIIADSAESDTDLGEA